MDGFNMNGGTHGEFLTDQFFYAGGNGMTSFHSQVKPILCFAGFALANADSVSEISFAARSIGLSVVCPNGRARLCYLISND
jgi:hypothetical protein